MTAIYEIDTKHGKRIMVVESVKGESHAIELGKMFGDSARLLMLQPHLLHYTSHEVETHQTGLQQG